MDKEMVARRSTDVILNEDMNEPCYNSFPADCRGLQAGSGCHYKPIK